MSAPLHEPIHLGDVKVMSGRRPRACRRCRAAWLDARCASSPCACACHGARAGEQAVTLQQQRLRRFEVVPPWRPPLVFDPRRHSPRSAQRWQLRRDARWWELEAKRAAAGRAPAWPTAAECAQYARELRDLVKQFDRGADIRPFVDHQRSYSR